MEKQQEVEEREKRYDLGFLKKISGDDHNFVKEMIETFRSTAPGTVKRMHDFFDQERYEALSREAHRFIPGVSFLGARDLEAEIVEIEILAKSGKDNEKISILLSSINDKVEYLIDSLVSDFNLKPDGS